MSAAQTRPAAKRSFGSLRVVRPPTTLRAQTLANLRRAIVDGSLRPGERLIERDLCTRLGVSRTLVREALRSLETEGLVHNYAQRGPSVVTLTAAEAAQVYEAREAVEGMACQIFAARAIRADLDRLKQALTALEQACEADNHGATLAAKTRFYDALMIGAANPILHDMARQLRARAAILRATSMSNAGRAKQSLVEMRLIAEALERGDPQAALAACVNHLRHARDAAIATLRAAAA
jgi:GntR family transcriptional regulator, trigonelline degradation regulator